ncbi:peptide ABC transporter substrate-binding protein [Candidatus Sumerlaeota bacterium]|nr:peptide ABC transporter substrate-binding protein [Candidatus Sumerlaeota bacterium]
MRKFFSTLLLLMMATAATAQDRTLRINIAVEPESMDPVLNESLAGSRVMKGLNEGLIRLDEKADAIPGIAKSWEHNADFTVWTFQLRTDAKWHDGSPVLAGDYVYSFSRIFTPSTAASYAGQTMGFFKGARKFMEAGGLDKQQVLEAVKAIDDHTLQFTLENPTPYFLGVLDLSCFMPVKKSVIDEGDPQWSRNPRKYIGTGAFKLAEYKSKDKVVLTKADTFYDKDNVFFDRVELYMIENPNTEEAAFRTNALDITNAVAVPQVAYWRDKPEWNSEPGFGTYWVGFNNATPPFDDVRVRKAFSMAINRRAITDKLLRRGEVPSTGIVPEMFISAHGGPYRNRTGNLVPNFDPEGAKKLLKEAGYGPGGKPFPLVSYVYDTNDEHKMIAEQLQAMWRASLGIDVKLENSDWGSYLTRGKTHDFTLMRRRWFGDYIDISTFTDLWNDGSTLNYEQYKNPRFLDLLNQAKKEIDPMKREDHLAAAEKLLVADDAVIAPLFTLVMPILIKTDITGVVRNATGTLDYTRARRTAPL